MKTIKFKKKNAQSNKIQHKNSFKTLEQDTDSLGQSHSLIFLLLITFIAFLLQYLHLTSLAFMLLVQWSATSVNRFSSSSPLQ